MKNMILESLLADNARAVGSHAQALVRRKLVANLTLIVSLMIHCAVRHVDGLHHDTKLALAAAMQLLETHANTTCDRVTKTNQPHTRFKLKMKYHIILCFRVLARSDAM